MTRIQRKGNSETKWIHDQNSTAFKTAKMLETRANKKYSEGPVETTKLLLQLREFITRIQQHHLKLRMLKARANKSTVENWSKPLVFLQLSEFVTRIQQYYLIAKLSKWVSKCEKGHNEL